MTWAARGTGRSAGEPSSGGRAARPLSARRPVHRPPARLPARPLRHAPARRDRPPAVPAGGRRSAGPRTVHPAASRRSVPRVRRRRSPWPGTGCSPRCHRSLRRPGPPHVGTAALVGPAFAGQQGSQRFQGVRLSVVGRPELVHEVDSLTERGDRLRRTAEVPQAGADAQQCQGPTVHDDARCHPGPGVVHHGEQSEVALQGLGVTPFAKRALGDGGVALDVGVDVADGPNPGPSVPLSLMESLSIRLMARNRAWHPRHALASRHVARTWMSPLAAIAQRRASNPCFRMCDQTRCEPDATRGSP